MACATLKRSLDWESLNQRPTKRRRCNPFGQSGSPGSSVRPSASATANGTDSAPVLGSVVQSPSNRYLKDTEPSPFRDATLAKMSQDLVAENLRQEIRRLHKRKQLPMSTNALERMQDSESSGSEMGPDSPRRPDSPPNMMRHPEKALFTFKQVQLICQKMMQEREDQLREKYETVLTNKLAEQYDAFVKFTYDQIQRRYEAAPSYLS